MTARSSHRLRFLVGVALAALLGAALLRAFVSGASKQIADEAEERKAIVTLQAVTSLVHSAGDCDAVRKVVAAWQARTPSVSQARVFLADGMRLEASTAAGDAGERAAPRRLPREEKPLYDRNQRIAAAAQTNREEQQARKAEIEAAPLGGGRLSLAGPVEKDRAPVGLVEIETALQPAPRTPGWSGFLLAVIAPLAAFALLALIIGERRPPPLLGGGARGAGPLVWVGRGPPA